MIYNSSETTLNIKIETDFSFFIVGDIVALLTL